MLSGVGIAALEVDEPGLKGLRAQKTLALPSPSQWTDPTLTLGGAKAQLTWLALGAERTWTGAGSARAAAKITK
jgi:aconitate hydratase